MQSEQYTILTSFSLHHGQFHWQQQLHIFWYTSSVIHTCSKQYLSQTFMWDQSSHSWWPPPISNRKKPTKISSTESLQLESLMNDPSQKEPRWLFWMSDDFKIFNCFYPPVANIWGILMFNLFVCCSTLLKALENLLVTTWMSLIDFKFMGKYNKLTGNKTAREFFLVLFFLPFSYESRWGHICSSWGKIWPAPTC